MLTSAAHARLRALATVTVAVLVGLPLSTATTAAAATAATAATTATPRSLTVAPASAVGTATVSGRVTDAAGDPVEGAPVGVVSVDPRSDAEEWTATDALGRYTVPSVPAGVAVVLSVESPAPWWHHQFWPGTSDPDDAGTLVLPAGDVRAGMDVTLPDAGGLAGTVQLPAGTDEYCVTASPLYVWSVLPTVTACAAAGEQYVVGPLPDGGYVVEAVAFASSGTSQTGSVYWGGRTERWAAEPVVVWGTSFREGIDLDLSRAPVLGSQPVTVDVSPHQSVPSDGLPATLAVRVTGSGAVPTGVVEIWGERGNLGTATLTDGVAYVQTEATADPVDVLYRGDAVHAPSHLVLELDVAPSVRGAEPAAGATSGGTRVSVRGVGLDGATGVTFGGVPGTDVEIVSDREVRVTAPAHAAGSVDLVVTSPRGSSNTMGQQYLFVDAVAVAPTRVVSDLSVPAGEARCAPLAGTHGVPADARGVMVNVTTVRPSGVGNVVVYPDADGTGRTPPPATSSVNFEPGQDVANGTFVALPPSGRICYATAGARQAGVLVDLTGWVAPDAGVVLRTPRRLLDTRPGTGHVGPVVGPVAPRRVYTVDVRGQAGVSKDAQGVLVNVTVTGATAPGNLRVFPAGGVVPRTSVVNYAPGRDKAAGTVVALPASGQLSFWSDTDASLAQSPVHVVIDVLGETSGASALQAVPPQRLLDTREDGPLSGPLTPRRVYAVAVPWEPSVPRDVAAVVLNVTAVGPGSVGHLRVYPDADGTGRTPPPGASSINYVAGRDIANQVVVAVPSDRKVLLYSDSFAPVHVVIDLVGHVAAE